MPGRRVDAVVPAGPTPAEFAAGLAFSLDPYQESALGSIHEGRSVLVAAPTGSGKTVVAEYAIARARAAGARAFYTTPLKALSNQKFRDLSGRFSASDVGLMTGDTSVNGDAGTVVMTTEVLRNMIYEGSDDLDRLGVVVLDEVHYLQNPYRGAVWEEVIIQSPRHVLLVCLSATVSNAEQFGDWLSTVRGDTDVVIEERRPVDLQNYYMVANRRTGASRLLPTFVGGQPNPDAAALDSPDAGETAGSGASGYVRRRARGPVTTPRRTDVVEDLADAGKIPAIYFIFSRDGCDRAARSCLQAGFRLTSPEDRELIRRVIEEKTECLSEGDLGALGFSEWAACLEAGFAAHHAGLVHPFKEAVESAFAQGAVKVVFATETLSLGINMPARSVVIERLTRFTGERIEHLTAGEYTQLTGRAGRRGIDSVGYGIVLWSATEAFSSVAALASSRTYELESSFRPSYNMAANMMRIFSREQAHHVLNSSFAQFRSDSEVVRLEAELAGLPQESRRAGALRRRIDAHAQSLGRLFDVVTAILESEGYVSGWSLTPRGERLARIYHECDLVISKALEAGIFDGVDVPGFAALVSLFTYEARSGPGARGTRSGGMPSPDLERRWREAAALAAAVAAAESRAGTAASRTPDAGFARLAHEWATGRDLAQVLRAGDGIPAGDVVRNMKQVVDVARQLGTVAPLPATAATARATVDALWRGVVAASSLVPAGAPGSP